MQHRKAIVTLAIGKPYFQHWKRYCEANWKAYAEKYGYDVVCLNRPLDESERSRKRSPAWQKCLILNQHPIKTYDRVIWIDSDILINTLTAPDIASGVPIERVGGVEDINFSRSEPVASSRYLERAFQFWPGSIINRTATEYYSLFGLPGDCNQCVNTGVLVLSPEYHRELLEYVYHHYEDKGGREWHMEMRPLSYHIVRSGQVHWIDSRFNLMWPYLEIMYYPFLLQRDRRNHERRKSLTVLEDHLVAPLRKRIHRRSLVECLTAAYNLSYFLHFGGMKTDEMGLVRLKGFSQHRRAA